MKEILTIKDLKLLHGNHIQRFFCNQRLNELKLSVLPFVYSGKGGIYFITKDSSNSFIVRKMNKANFRVETIEIKNNLNDSKLMCEALSNGLVCS